MFVTNQHIQMVFNCLLVFMHKILGNYGPYRPIIFELCNCNKFDHFWGEGEARFVVINTPMKALNVSIGQHTSTSNLS